MPCHYPYQSECARVSRDTMRKSCCIPAIISYLFKRVASMAICSRNSCVASTVIDQLVYVPHVPLSEEEMGLCFCFEPRMASTHCCSCRFMAVHCVRSSGSSCAHDTAFQVCLCGGRVETINPTFAKFFLDRGQSPTSRGRDSRG